MNKIIVNILHALAILAMTAAILFFTSLSVQAAEIPDVYTNDNFWNSAHDTPVSFTVDALGNFSGVTTTGKTFTQKNIVNTVGVRLQRFAIDEAFFYVSDRGIIIAPNNAQALSIYLDKTSST